MTYSELIQLYFERSNALQWYWTLYVVIIGGLLAFSSLRQRRDAITGILVTVLYCCFAYKNLGAIEETQAQTGAALQAIQDLQASHGNPGGPGEPQISFQDAGGPQAKLINPTLNAPDLGGTRNFHVTCDVITIAVLWAMELRRVKQARDTAAKAST